MSDRTYEAAVSQITSLQEQLAKITKIKDELERQNQYMREALRSIARGEVMEEKAQRTAEEVLNNSTKV